MNVISILFVFIGIICTRAEDRFVTYDDFSPSELANVLTVRNREMMLQKLASKEDRIVASAFYFEILAIGSGDYFFWFDHGENASITIKNNAIIRAMFDCLKNLQLQDQAEDILQKIFLNGANYVRSLGNFSVAHTLLCSNIDSFLRNETLYVELRDEYTNKVIYADRTYHYFIKRNKATEIFDLTTIMSHPKIQQFIAHRMWIWISNSNFPELKERKHFIMDLAKVSDLAKEVQKIYQQSIDEVIPLIDMQIKVFHGPWENTEYLNYLQPNLTEKIWKKIIEKIPEWKDYVECEKTSDSTMGLSDTVSEQSKKIQGRHCGKMSIKQDPVDHLKLWPVTTDFNPSVLDKLTLEQQHELFLKELSKKSSREVMKFLLLESLAKSIGNDFFGLVKDKTLNHENNAILRAAYDCMTNLQLVSRTNIIFFAAVEPFKNAQPIGDIGMAFTQMCLVINDALKNEVFYITRRNNYLKQNLLEPKKTYQYGFGKPGEVQRQIIATLLNDIKLKKIVVLHLWGERDASSRKSREEKIKYAVTEMEKISSKSEAVNRIFDQSVNETLKVIGDFLPAEIFPIMNSDNRLFVFDLRTRDWPYHQHFLSNRIIANMHNYADLSTLFTANIQEQSDTSNGPSTAEEPTMRPIASKTPTIKQTTTEPPLGGWLVSKTSLGGLVPSTTSFSRLITSTTSPRGPIVIQFPHASEAGSSIFSSPLLCIIYSFFSLSRLFHLV